MRANALALACMLSTSALSTASGQEALTALVGGSVIDVATGAIHSDALVILEGDRIRSVGTPDEIQLGEGMRIVDARGKWILPGLIDTHIHFFQSGGLYTRPDVIDLRNFVPYEEELAGIRADLDDTFRRYLRCGVTSVADNGGPFWNFEVRELARGNPMAPRVAIAGPLISTYQPAALTTADPPILKVDTPAAARALAERQIERDTDFIKLWFIVRPGETPEQHLPIVRAAVAAADAARRPVMVHATELATARAAVQAGADILVHSVFGEDIDEEFVQLCKQRDIIYVPTLIVREGYGEVLGKKLDLLAAELAYASPRIVASLLETRALAQEELGAQARARLTTPRPLPDQLAEGRSLKRLHDAGVTIALGTDAGNIGTLHGPSVYRELELMCAAGLTPLEALRAATMGGARLLGLQDSLGQVKAAFHADLVLLDANPLEDILHTCRIHAVVRAGRYYTPSELIEERPEDLIQRQANAYNARHLEALMATFHPAAELLELPSGKVIAKGREALHPLYADLFEASPELHCKIAKRIVHGRFVIDHEHLTGYRGDNEKKAVAIYEIKDGLIRRVWFPR